MPTLFEEPKLEVPAVELPEDELVSDDRENESHWTDELPMELGDVPSLPYEEACERLRQALAEGYTQAKRGEFVETSLEEIIRKSKARMEGRNG